MRSAEVDKLAVSVLRCVRHAIRVHPSSSNNQCVHGYRRNFGLADSLLSAGAFVWRGNVDLLTFKFRLSIFMATLSGWTEF